MKKKRNKLVEIRCVPKVYRSIILSLICCCCLMILSGCGPSFYTVHAYDGDHLSENKLAKIIMEKRDRTGWDKLFSAHPSSISMAAFDNKNPEDYEEGYVFLEELMVLPGTHTYGITFKGPHATQAGIIPALIAAGMEGMKYGPLGTELTFESDAGHEYIIRFKEEIEFWKGVVSVSYWVEDVNSGEVVVGERPPVENEIDI